MLLWHVEQATNVVRYIVFALLLLQLVVVSVMKDGRVEKMLPVSFLDPSNQALRHG